jgi:hypothetical protein
VGDRELRRNRKVAIKGARDLDRVENGGWGTAPAVVNYAIKA